MYKLPDTLTDDIQYIDSLINDYKAGKLEETRFKAVRVPMGIYEQRKNGTYMVRVRCTGGFITPIQLLTLSEIARKVNAPFLHITTRQEIQLHYITLDQITSILEPLQQVELGTKGGGGNTIRNIMVDIRAGIDKREVFDPYPYAADLTTFLLTQNDSFTLPRKLKIAFAISEEKADYALVNDLGFIPRIVDGQKGFKVYMGGSVASKPTKGWLLFDFIPEKDFFRVAVAVKRFFSENGNRKNRHKARIRHIFYKLGAEKVFEIFQPYYEEAKKDVTLNYTSSVSVINYEHPEKEDLQSDLPDDYFLWKKRYVTPQKQTDLYAVIVPFQHGNASPDIFRQIAIFTSRFGNDVLRFTTRQHLQLRNIPEKWLYDVFLLSQQLGIQTHFPSLVNDIISCTGADTCRLGICFSKGAAKAIRQRLEKSSLPLDKLKNIRVNISGCSNSCAQQVWSDIGFSGRVSRNDRMFPAYTVYARIKGENNMAQSLGMLAARDLPEFTEKLFHSYLEQQVNYTSFQEYLEQKGSKDITQLLESFQPIPTFTEDKNYYYDWGAEEVFSVSERGKAECSAGLFDMIDLDKDIIEKSREELKNITDNKRRELLLYDIAYSASRMLLITKGAEPRTTEESFDLFKQHFIEEGLIDKKYSSLLEQAKNKYPLATLEKEILALGEDVIELYGTMDDSLQFRLSPTPLKGELEIHEESSLAPKEESREVLIKDFRGVGCPMNFVKTKLALATIQTGNLLEIWLDDGPPIENVPGSVRNEGHEIISLTQEKENEFWKVVIKKQ